MLSRDLQVPSFGSLSPFGTFIFFICNKRRVSQIGAGIRCTIGERNTGSIRVRINTDSRVLYPGLAR